MTLANNNSCSAFLMFLVALINTEIIKAPHFDISKIVFKNKMFLKFFSKFTFFEITLGHKILYK